MRALTLGLLVAIPCQGFAQDAVQQRLKAAALPFVIEQRNLAQDEKALCQADFQVQIADLRKAAQDQIAELQKELMATQAELAALKSKQQEPSP